MTHIQRSLLLLLSLSTTSAHAEAEHFIPSLRLSIGAGPSLRDTLYDEPTGYGGALRAQAELSIRSRWLGASAIASIDAAAYSGGALDLPLMLGLRFYVWRVFIGVSGGVSAVDRQPLDYLDEFTVFRHPRLALPLGLSWDRWELFAELYASFNTGSERTATGDEDILDHARGGSLVFCWRLY